MKRANRTRIVERDLTEHVRQENAAYRKIIAGERKRKTYHVGGERLVKPEFLEHYALIIRCIHQRGEDQKNCLVELGRRGLWLTEEQKQQAGLPPCPGT